MLKSHQAKNHNENQQLPIDPLNPPEEINNANDDDGDALSEWEEVTAYDSWLSQNSKMLQMILTCSFITDWVSHKAAIKWLIKISVKLN